MAGRCLIVLLVGSVLTFRAAHAEQGGEPSPTRYEYKLLATSKTSTMEKELNEAAEAGFRFEGVMGGDTSFGGKEVVCVLGRPSVSAPSTRFHYKLLATNKTSTMQKEMAQAAEEGFLYRGQTVTETLFGGKETVIIMERDREIEGPRFEYKLLATNKTSTMQKELSEAGDASFVFKGVTVGKTAFGGSEIVVITERPVKR